MDITVPRVLIRKKVIYGDGGDDSKNSLKVQKMCLDVEVPSPSECSGIGMHPHMRQLTRSIP
jgi:hypothetical protein